MPQTELNHEVSRATGESLRTIRRRGFSILQLPSDSLDEEPETLPLQIVDWDAVDAFRRRAA